MLRLLSFFPPSSHLLPASRTVRLSLTGLLLGIGPYGLAETPSFHLGTINVATDGLDADEGPPRRVRTATKTDMAIKDVPATIDVIEVDQHKVYGIQDLNEVLDGIAGVDTHYDMRSDGILLRGFEASDGDIYRDGVRASGQIRRSTANVAQIDILKGPASVLYGRGSGGGVVNLISKEANFEAPSSLAVRLGRWHQRGTMLDVNHILSPNLALRLTADYEQADAFRQGIRHRTKMISPSVLFDSQNGHSWLLQYTHDDVWRRPDRAPSYGSLPDNVPMSVAYAHPNDDIEDRLRLWRSVLNLPMGADWSLRWTSTLHRASQNFDHLYGGSYCQHNGQLLNTGRPCPHPGQMTFIRAWQQTENQTRSHLLDVTGSVHTGPFKHEVLIGLEHSIEKRLPRLATSRTDPSLNYPWPIDPYAPQWLHEKSPRGEATTNNHHRAQTKALYAQDVIHLTPTWQAMLGGRYEQYVFQSTDRIKHQQRRYRGSVFSPRVGLVWQATPQHHGYLSYSKNFSPYGGRGLIAVSTAQTAVFDDQPQYAKQYEVGVKSDWLEEALSSQLSVYDLTLANVRYRPDAENRPYDWALRGKEQSRGVEFSLTGKIAQKWSVRGQLGRQQAKVKQDAQKPELTGHHKANVAKNNGSLFVRYRPNEQWYGEVGSVFKSSVYTHLDNAHKRPGYGLLHASMGYRSKDVTVTLAATNLANTRYWRSSNHPGTPRAVLLSSAYWF
ncbi:MAG: TonB-dependent siderophore receptor [Neisseriaceae bacterium]|nr:TonB-dependent siderophore receptor [Neisseriaceae bacterium]